MLKKITTAAVGAALILPAAGSATAAANDMPQRDGGDRYELVPARSAGVRAQAAQRNPKTGVEAARLVDRVAKRIARRYDLDCRAYEVDFGKDGVVECKGSTRGKRELAKQVR